MYESHEVLAERARVALIRLQLILKPALKKEKKVPCLLGRSHHSLFQMDGGIVPLNVGVSAFFDAKIGGTSIGLYGRLSVTELDSHANMAVAGEGCTIIAKSGQYANITSFSA